MKINFTNEKKVEKYLSYISSAVLSAEKYLKLSCSDLELSITFLSKSKIKKLNKSTRGINKVTDVLSYPLISIEGSVIDKKLSKKNMPYDINPETGNINLGDIVICIKQCLKQSKMYGTTPEREISYLATHGFLHLLGYDHIEDVDKAVMRQKEEAILDFLKLNIN